MIAVAVRLRRRTYVWTPGRGWRREHAPTEGGCYGVLLGRLDEDPVEWVRACEVRAGDYVLDLHGFERVAESAPALSSKGWFVEYAIGCRYLHPQAPVAVRPRTDP